MIEIDFYHKTYSACPACDRMGKTLDRWIEENPEKNINVNWLSAEDHAVELRAREVSAAPVIVIRRSKNTAEEIVSGNNPDILIDILDGKSSVWD